MSAGDIFVTDADRRIAKLEAENKRLIDALKRIMGDHKGTEHNAFYDCQDIAKDALNEGK